MAAFQEFYKDRAKSHQRIENLRLPKTEGKYSLIAVHASQATYDINKNIKMMLDELSGSIDKIILFEDLDDAPDFLKNTNLPTDVYRDDIPEKFNGSRYILTGYDLVVCLSEHYKMILAITDKKLVEVNIPLGAAEYSRAAEYSKLQEEGKTGFGFSYNLSLYWGVRHYHELAQIWRVSRGSSALTFDGELIDAIDSTGKELSTLVNFYSSTEKFLEWDKQNKLEKNI